MASYYKLYVLYDISLAQKKSPGPGTQRSQLQRLGADLVPLRRASMGRWEDPVLSLGHSRGKIIEKWRKMLKNHGKMLKNDGKMLKNHGTMLKDDGKMLKNHGKMLKDDGKMMETWWTNDGNKMKKWWIHTYLDAHEPTWGQVMLLLLHFVWCDMNRYGFVDVCCSSDPWLHSLFVRSGFRSTMMVNLHCVSSLAPWFWPPGGLAESSVSNWTVYHVQLVHYLTYVDLLIWHIDDEDLEAK